MDKTAPLDLVEPRKVIQIQTLVLTAHTNPLLYALCDDGTIWQRAVNYGSQWVALKPPPQGEVKEGNDYD